MKYKYLFFFLIFSAAFLSSCVQNEPKINGISFVASPEKVRLEHLVPVKKLNANHASVMPFGFIRNISDPIIYYNTNNQWYGETFEGAKQYIEALHQQNIQVMLKPQIWISHGDLKLGLNLKEVLSDEHGKARAIVISETGEEIPCDFVGLTAGVSPNISFLKNSGIELGRGIKVNRFLETNIKDIFAIGDCAEQTNPIENRRAIEAVWYTGRMMGETIAQTICGNRIEYKPGIWFNSAKFFDIEYQTYGWVHGKIGRPNYEDHVHWRHHDDTKCITLAFHKETQEFLGINVFGIRMRHEVFNSWLYEKKTIQFVIDHLHKANFDPEFFKKYEDEIRQSFSNQSLTVS